MGFPDLANNIMENTVTGLTFKQLSLVIIYILHVLAVFDHCKSYLFKAFSIAILIFFIIILSRIVYLLHFIYACTDENCMGCVSILIYLHQLNYVSPTLCDAITVWSLCYHLSDCIN